MKIDSVRIKLFGKLANRDVGPLDPGMTVFFGENESGKTTLKEFIRTTLFRTGKRKGVYPQHEKTDSGEVDCITDDGKKFTVTRNGTKSSSDTGVMPEDLTGITPEVYQKVYAMNPEDLIDTELVASGDIKRRFLTIPGGENLPRISEDINTGMNDLLNDSRHTDNKGIGKILKEIEEVKVKIEDAKTKGPEYGRLAAEEEEKEKEILVLKEEQEKRQEILELSKKHKTLNQTVSNLNEFTETRKTMEDADKAPAEGLDTCKELKLKVENAAKKKESAEKSFNEIKESVGDADSGALIENSEKIRYLNENIGTHRSAETRKSEIETELNETRSKISKLMESEGLNDGIIDSADTGPETVRRAETPLTKTEINYIPPLLAVLLGFLFTGIAAVTGTVPIYAVGAVMFVLGAVLVLRSRSGEETKDDFPDFIAAKGFPRETTRSEAVRLIPMIEEIRKLRKVGETQISKISDQDDILRNLNKELKNVIDAVGWTSVTFEEDVRRLRKTAENVPRLAEASENFTKATEEFSTASSEMNGYLQPYGSYEELERIVNLKAERDKLDVRINGLKEALENYGVNPNEEIPELPEDRQNEIDELQRHIGRIQREKKNILNDSDTERLYNERSALEAELEEQVRRWGVLSLERTIVDNACDDIYENMQPAVIQTADRYLGMMTGGEYRLYNDPRTNDVAVITGTEVKTGDKWSSGLAGQVCLSLKLAVAKELSKETLPILLDDVLLVFDSERKKGACEALAEVAEEMQILLFTCDRETRGYMSEIGAEIIKMER